jgi:MFS family permease
MFGVWNPHAGFGVFLPVLAREFGWSRGAISVAASLNSFVGGAIGFAVGAANDRYGPRPILALGALLVGFGYLFASALHALWHFYFLLGGLLGVAMAGMYFVPIATVSRWFAAQRGLALGIVQAGVNLPFITGGPLCAFLIGRFGWRRAYLMLAGLVWAVSIPASLLTRLPAGDGSRVARATLSTGMTFKEALADRRLWLLSGALALLGFTYMMVVVHIVPYVKDRGVTLEAASLALTIFGFSQIGGGLVFGAVADRLGTRRTFGFCLVIELLTLVGVVVGPRLGLLYFLIMCLGLGAAGADTSLLKSISEIFGVRAIGAILGTMNLGWRLGAGLGPAAAGFIYDATGSYTVAFGIASAGLAVSLTLFTLGSASRRPGQ